MVEKDDKPDPHGILDATERHLVEAPIEFVAAFCVTADPGGGHQLKRTVMLPGGQPLIAKCAPSGDLNQLQQAKHEAAAWRLLRLLGWTDLGAVTVMREVDVPNVGVVQAAVHPVYPAAMLLPAAAPDSLDPDQTFRAAIFDFLLLNCDRGGHNWFGITNESGATPRLKLYDHGHCFGLHGQQVNSTFVTYHAGTGLPDAHRLVLRELTDDVLERLAPLLTPDVIRSVGARRDELLVANDMPLVATAA